MVDQFKCSHPPPPPPHVHAYLRFPRKIIQFLQIFILPSHNNSLSGHDVLAVKIRGSECKAICHCSVQILTPFEQISALPTPFPGSGAYLPFPVHPVLHFNRKHPHISQLWPNAGPTSDTVAQH